MSPERSAGELPGPPATPGATEWMALADELLAGLVHAVNNRVTAMSVCVELAGLGDDQMLRDGLLALEVGRLQRTGALLGHLPARGHAEAMEIVPVLEDVLAIHAHHPRMRGIECTVSVLGSPPPVRVPRWALLRLLLLLLDDAKAAAREANRETVTVELSGDPRELRVSLPAGPRTSAYAMAMASLCGGVLQREGADAALRLPGLSEVRLRERAASASG